MKPSFVTRAATTFATIDLGEKDYQSHYYAGFANRSLWPLLHYRTGLVTFSRDDYRGYRATNAKFAEALKPLLRPDDVLWVHDYHLIPLGRALREAGVGQRIGFFLHIPFTPFSVFDILPPARELPIADLAAYDVVGFQTTEDRDNFQACARKLLANDEPRPRALSAALAIPVGIDAKAFARMATTSRMTAELHRLKDSLVGRKLIIGADRLDYSKGLPQRFEAYSELLETHARLSRENQLPAGRPALARGCERISRTEEEPRPAHRQDQRQICGIRLGASALYDLRPVAPPVGGFLPHGLDRPGDALARRDESCSDGVCRSPGSGASGVLVLSRFAGAAASLDAALIVNPFDTRACSAEAIHQGLMMSRDERQARWRSSNGQDRDG